MLRVLGKIYGENSEFEGFIIDKEDTFPSSPSEAQIFWHNVNKKLYVYDGSNWIQFGLIDSTLSSSTTLDNLLITNNLNVTNSTTLNDLTVSGDVYFQSNLYTKDNVIWLNYGEPNSGVSQNGTTAGLRIDRGILPDLYIRWNESQHRWEITTDGNTFYQIVDTQYGNSNYLKLDGTNQPTNSLNMGLVRITNVTDPINSQDVATKNYVDSVNGSWNDYSYTSAYGGATATVYLTFNDPVVILRATILSVTHDVETVFTNLIPIVHAPSDDVSNTVKIVTTGTSTVKYGYITINSSGDLKVYQSNGDSLNANVYATITYVV